MANNNNNNVVDMSNARKVGLVEHEVAFGPGSSLALEDFFKSHHLFHVMYRGMD